MKENWTGKKYTDWLDIYENDTRKVHYKIDGEHWGEMDIIHFTSDTVVDSIWILRMMFMKIRYAKIELNEWYISLCY